jgi:hypothetical protein
MLLDGFQEDRSGQIAVCAHGSSANSGGSKRQCGISGANSHPAEEKS